MATPTPSSPKITTATTKSQRKEYAHKHAEALALIFRTDPGIRFVTSSLSREDHNAYLHSYMGALMKGSLLNNAVFQEVNDWSCVAVWMPPGKRVDNPWTMLPAGLVGVSLKLGISGIKKMLVDFVAQVDALKKKYLTQQGIKKYWYFFFIGTLEEARGNGLASNVIREWQKNVATKENLPIWLESTTENSKKIYEKCGFKVLEEVVVGRGTHDANGEEEKGGPGVTLWAMLWTPEGYKAPSA